MANNQNFLLAILLSFIVLVAWQYFVIGPQIEAERERQERAERMEQVETPRDPTAIPLPEPAPHAAPQPDAVPAVPAAPAAPQVARDERVLIHTPSLEGSINLTGGRIDDLLLTQYRETVDPESPLVRLFSPSGTEEPYYAEFGWVTPPGGPAVPNSNTRWTASGGPLRAGREVTLSWDNGEGFIFRNVISVDSNYMFTVHQSVENRTGETATLYPYGLVNRTGRPETWGFFILHEGLIGYFNDNGGLTEYSYGNLDDQRTITPERVETGWLGITDKYWAAALVPGEGTFQGRFVRGDAGDEPTYQADFLGDPVTVPAHASAASQTLLFAGAKEVSVVDGYEAAYGIPRFELLVDWGWFHFLTKPLFLLLDWFGRLFGNFGLAILAVTVLVKLLFFPLANKAYASMSRMKKLQPEMMKLQERYKDDKMALQKELMELYKKEKINPLSGCWPIVIQIPVFFALYKVLFVTIEMRHAPFYGWIQDLSAPDPTSIFNLFGLIPWDPPTFLMVGLWPIIMGVTMFIQMRLNPQPPDKTQQMIFNWMPLFFTFLLATFPVGLVIYWAWNNFLSILQQAFIMRRHGVKIELWDNLKGLISRGKPKEGPAE